MTFAGFLSPLRSEIDMKDARLSTWVLVAALLWSGCLSYSGCGRDAFAVVQVSGFNDDRVQRLALTATVGGRQAVEDYAGHPREVSFFIPEGALGSSLSVKIDAWASTCILATGSASGTVENRPRLDLSIQLQLVQNCP